MVVEYCDSCCEGTETEDYADVVEREEWLLLDSSLDEESCSYCENGHSVKYGCGDRHDINTGYVVSLSSRTHNERISMYATKVSRSIIHGSGLKCSRSVLDMA